MIKARGTRYKRQDACGERPALYSDSRRLPLSATAGQKKARLEGRANNHQRRMEESTDSGKGPGNQHVSSF